MGARRTGVLGRWSAGAALGAVMLAGCGSEAAVVEEPQPYEGEILVEVVHETPGGEARPLADVGVGVESTGSEEAIGTGRTNDEGVASIPVSLAGDVWITVDLADSERLGLTQAGSTLMTIEPDGPNLFTIVMEGTGKFPDDSFAHSATWSYANEQDFTFDSTISFGDPQRGEALAGTSHPLNSDQTVGSACSFDPESDAVVAGNIEVTATTEGFATSISTAFSTQAIGTESPADGMLSDDGRVEVEHSYTSGPSCSYLDSNTVVDRASVRWDEPVPTGSSKQHSFFLILKGYYSPRTPDGDTNWLNMVAIVPSPGGSRSTPSDLQQMYEPDRSTSSGITLSGRAVTR